MKTLDSGHKYELLTLDGDWVQTLTFVKREGEKFPGNVGHYPGTTLQSVIRCLIDRTEYLQNQIPHKNNLAVIENLERCLWLLEDRAAERHDLDFDFRIHDIKKMPMCKHCGHVVCNEFK